METTTTTAGQLAINFLMDDLAIPTEDREWFAVLDVRPVGESWCVVEVGVEGLPDKWVLQVYDTGECDPSYTFSSPVSATEDDTGLEELPNAIAAILISERNGGLT